MQVWVFNAPDENAVDFIFSSISEGVSRFGWSYIPTADITKLEEKDWSEMTEDETICYKAGRFLQEIDIGDWIVHINVPEYGKCTAGIVNRKYEFDRNGNKMGREYTKSGDYRHTIGLEKETIITFDRNDENVLPYISRRLKLQGKHWQIYDVDDFTKSIENLKQNLVQTSENVTHGIYHLRQDIMGKMGEVTAAIQRHHPGKKLEEFFAFIFENVPNVKEVKINGSGWGTDFGADLIVTYNAGLPIVGLEKTEVLVVQIKSFTGEHHSIEAVDQIKTAIDKYEADSGMIISTAKASEGLLKEIERACKTIDKKILLLSGPDVASFALKYGSNVLFNS